jgi:hypothetical protein
VEGGTNIGGYTPTSASYNTGSVTAMPPLNTPNLTFYLVYPANPVAVTYTYCVTVTGQTTCPQAAATFNVTGPTGVTMNSTAYSALTIDDWTADGSCITPFPYLVYGNVSWSVQNGQCISSGSYGFTATPSGTASGGNLSFIQLGTGGSVSGGINCTDVPGLDNKVPYPYVQSATNTAYDFPAAPLKSTFTSLSRKENYTMYLMWQSTAANSIMVPIGSQMWTYWGSAICTNNSCGSAASWTPTTQSAELSGQFVPSTASQPNDGYPIWNGLLDCK